MRVEVSKYIVIDTEICHGRPTFKGTRIIVSDILELLSSGMSAEEICKSYPGLTKEMILDAINYAAKLIESERYVEPTKISTR